MYLQTWNSWLQYVTRMYISRFVWPTLDESWSKTGEICLDVLKSQWSPAWTISTACTAVRALLESPEPDSPLNIDVGNLIICLFSSSSQSSTMWWSGGLRQSRQNVYSHVCQRKNKTSVMEWEKHEDHGAHNLWSIEVSCPSSLPCEMIKFYLSIHWKMSLISCGHFICLEWSLYTHLNFYFMQWICWLKATCRCFKQWFPTVSLLLQSNVFAWVYIEYAINPKSSFNAINTSLFQKWTWS